MHTVFNVDKSNVIGLVDEAWTQKGVGERGIRRNIGYFESEEEACDCLLKEIKKIVNII